MSQPVDLTNFREMTDGDVELEKELFDEFISSSIDGIAVMANSLGKGESDAWRATAHALKGVAQNLGAKKLGKLLEQGQSTANADRQTKQKILTNIDDEFTAVREYLRTALLN
jgi:HPt (histidine-containing phosphotransfer) domain-containing protein